MMQNRGEEQEYVPMDYVPEEQNTMPNVADSEIL